MKRRTIRVALALACLTFCASLRAGTEINGDMVITDASQIVTSASSPASGDVSFSDAKFHSSEPGVATLSAAVTGTGDVYAEYAHAKKPQAARSVKSRYVQDGLIAMWDAVDNMGIGSHVANATTWRDLVGGHADMTFTATPTVGATEVPPGGSWPLLTMRQMTATSQDPATMAELIRIHARHPGGCDEMWLAEGVAFLTAESNVVARARTLAGYRQALDAAGIVAGFQQGFTLGHGAELGFSRGREIGFPETAGQTDAQGRRMGLVCPNSSEALAEEERFAENVVREGRLESFWLDDDLRFGFKS